MALTTVILAGLTGSVLDAVREQLSQRYPGVVIRGLASATRNNRLAFYDAGEITKVLGQAVDGVFGSSKRPIGFCQNSQRGCQKKVADGKCDRADNQTCALEKPARLFLIYQQGENEEALLRGFAHAALPFRMPRSTYGQRRNAADMCEAAIKTLNERAASIECHLSLGSALLLPPKAFGQRRAVNGLLERIALGNDPVRELRSFRQNHYDKAARAFVGRSRLGFSPGQDAGLHGEPHDANDPSIALSRRYRLGCVYQGSFHWDVSPLDGSHLAGNYEFQTRDKGSQRPQGRNANVLVDDCLR